LWYCDDSGSDENSFVYQKNGLFPAAYPPTDNLQTILEYYTFMGIFLAKSLQDQRLVDMPFSYPFLKVICAYKEETRDVAAIESIDKSSQTQKDPTSSDDSEAASASGGKLDLEGILNLDDLILIDPHRGSLLKQLKVIVEARKEKNDLDNDDDIIVDLNGSKISLEDLG
jgi:hypothetical protein